MLVHFLLWTAVYLLIGLGTARVAYGIERSRIIAQEGGRHGDTDPVEAFLECDHRSTAVLSCVYGLSWPLVVPAFVLGRGAVLAVTARPPRSRHERVPRADALDARIRELEDSLGIPDHAPDHAPDRAPDRAPVDRHSGQQ